MWLLFVTVIYGLNIFSKGERLIWLRSWKSWNQSFSPIEYGNNLKTGLRGRISTQVNLSSLQMILEGIYGVLFERILRCPLILGQPNNRCLAKNLTEIFHIRWGSPRQNESKDYALAYVVKSLPGFPHKEISICLFVIQNPWEWLQWHGKIHCFQERALFHSLTQVYPQARKKRSGRQSRCLRLLETQGKLQIMRFW